MKQTDPQLKLRVPPRLMEQIRKAADAGRRTLSAEIVGRLERSFDLSTPTPAMQDVVDQTNLEERVEFIEARLGSKSLEDDLMYEIGALIHRVEALEGKLKATA